MWNLIAYREILEKEQVKNKLFSKIQKTAGCWFWLGNTQLRFSVNYKQYKARTLIWEFYKEEKVPQSMIIKVSCENKICVNPEHFELGRKVYPGKS